MKEITITENEAGGRLDKFLLKYFRKAPSSLIYKYLRKKDIRLNGKKAKGNERLSEGDTVQIRLNDEVADSLTGADVRQASFSHIRVVYEDAQVLILDKPAGILTQKAREGDVSLNEEMISYLLSEGEVTQESLRRFKPSVLNRLDRNTCGIVLCAKSLRASQEISALIRGGKIRKIYQCIVIGTVTESACVRGYLIKDEAKNRVRILDQEARGAVPVETRMRPLRSAGGYSHLEVELVTGRSHQIRAQMAALGHPVAGDVKYGGRTQGLSHQMLCACRVTFPETDSVLGGVSHQTFEAPLPADFRRFLGKF